MGSKNKLLKINLALIALPISIGTTVISCSFNKYNIIFEDDNNVIALNENADYYLSKYGMYLKEPMLKDGYEFKGWKLNGKYVNKIKKGHSGDVLISVEYQKVNSEYDKYKNKYDALLSISDDILKGKELFNKNEFKQLLSEFSTKKSLVIRKIEALERDIKEQVKSEFNNYITRKISQTSKYSNSHKELNLKIDQEMKEFTKELDKFFSSGSFSKQTLDTYKEEIKNKFLKYEFDNIKLEDSISNEKQSSINQFITKNFNVIFNFDSKASWKEYVSKYKRGLALLKEVKRESEKEQLFEIFEQKIKEYNISLFANFESQINANFDSIDLLKIPVEYISVFDNEIREQFIFLQEQSIINALDLQMIELKNEFSSNFTIEKGKAMIEKFYKLTSKALAYIFSPDKYQEIKLREKYFLAQEAVEEFLNNFNISKGFVDSLLEQVINNDIANEDIKNAVYDLKKLVNDYFLSGKRKKLSTSDITKIAGSIIAGAGGVAGGAYLISKGLELKKANDNLFLTKVGLIDTISKLEIKNNKHHDVTPYSADTKSLQMLFDKEIRNALVKEKLKNQFPEVKGAENKVSWRLKDRGTTESGKLKDTKIEVWYGYSDPKVITINEIKGFKTDIEILEDIANIEKAEFSNKSSILATEAFNGPKQVMEEELSSTEEASQTTNEYFQKHVYNLNLPSGVKWKLVERGTASNSGRKIGESIIELYFREDDKNETSKKKVYLNGFSGFKKDNNDTELTKSITFHYRIKKTENGTDKIPQQKVENWGMHLWGDGWKGGNIDWNTNPHKFTESDESGFKKITISNIDSNKDLWFIVHDMNHKNNEAMLLDTSHSDVWFNEGDPNPHYKKPIYWLDRFERVAYDELEIDIITDNNKSINGDEYKTKLKLFNTLDKYNSLVPIDSNNYEISKINNGSENSGLDNDKKRTKLKIKFKPEYLKKPSKHYNKIDLGDVFTVSYDGENLGAATYARRLFEGDEYTYDTDYMWYWMPDLGANMISSTEVEVKLWAPASKTVHIQLYDKNNHNKKVGNPIALTQGDKKNERIWSAKIHTQMPELYWEFPYFASLDGYYYEYILNMNTKYEKIVLDPYAKSMAAHKPGEVGKGAFVDMNSLRAGIYNLSKSQGIFSGGLEGKLNKMIGYEVHVRDYTISRDDVAYKGTFRGMANWDAGIEYLKDLGITHVQFLPLQNYSSVDETSQGWTNGNGEVKKEGEKEVYTRTKAPNYNWGYDPHNYFTIEGWLSSDPKDPYSRISELRMLIKKLHDNGIGVIADVVYNHMAENWFLDNIVPNHYFRRPGGPTPVGGPALASENKMARKIIIESAKWLVDQYGVDGFRFDLMGFIDKETIRLIKDKVKTPDGHDLIMYGESWDFSDLPKNQRLVKGETKALEGGVPGVGYFNDTIRDIIKGQVGDHEGTKKGWVHTTNDDNGWEKTRELRAALIAGITKHAQKKYKNGNSGELEAGDNYADIFSKNNNPKNEYQNKNSLTNKEDYVTFTNEPSEAIQYQTIHDGYTLWDKLNIASPKKYTNELKNKNNKYDSNIEQKEIDYKIKLAKQSLGLMFAGQGRIVLQGGDEIGRTKPLSVGDSNPERAEGSENAIIKDALPDILNKGSGKSKVIIDYKYHDNSYNASDWANSYKWKRYDDPKFAKGAFRNLHKYVKDVIKLRKENYEFRFETAQEIVDNFRFIGGKNNNHNIEGEYKSEDTLSSIFQENKAKVIIFNLDNTNKFKEEVDGKIEGDIVKFTVEGKEYSLKVEKQKVNRDKKIYVNKKLLTSNENNKITATELLNNVAPYNKKDENSDKIIQYKIEARNNKNYSQFIVMSNPFDDAILINEQIDESWELLIGENGKPELITQEDKERGYVAGTPIAPAHSTVILGKRRKFKSLDTTEEKVEESSINALFSNEGAKLSFEDVKNENINQFEGKIDWNLPEGYKAEITKVEKKTEESKQGNTNGVLITYNVKPKESARKKRSIDSQPIEKQLWIPEYSFKNKLINLAENVEVKLNDKLLNLTWDEAKRRHPDFIKKNLIFTNIKEQKLFFNNLEVKIKDNQIRVNFDI
ncbi:pullulanase-associated domain-containing protein [Mycoplasma phocimorsus]|uniref:pullulanase-associated domain-containing protein n=1 Tax=Mycoplasma phocimorsus TaxID=3045839 RepID=UPI0024C0356B|nr:pullulanase-associated domain-containing protein [Mycoplasma phocimorsus]MDJ1647302.1 hypothetical protein [Mycoplasma phocimorsus]